MYETFEHTADIGIRVRSNDLDGLFADAARGLFAIMIENFDAVRSLRDIQVGVQADDLEELLHDWLAELLYTFHAQRLALADFQVKVTPERRTGVIQLTATAKGEPIDLKRHQLDVEVKAITWHGLKVKQTGDQWLAEVVVDI